MKRELELYIHIPFCVKKCNYCDFLSFHAGEEIQDAYISQLLREIALSSGFAGDYSVRSVFIGGGTPSIISEHHIAGILETINKYYYTKPDIEITIECNPASAMRHKFAEYKKAGINRLSIGLQSADNAELKMLGRAHTFEEFLKCYQSARMEGFDNINVDLISCIPMQSIRTWKKTLKNTLMLKVDHVSVYNLMIEEGTPFYEMNTKGLLIMPSEEEQAEIDRFTLECMKQYGYERYEFSNFCKPGRQCRHNTGYWSGVPYIGFGIGAASCFENVRWNNIRDIRKYLRLDLDGYFGGVGGPIKESMLSETQIESAEQDLRTDVTKLSQNDRMEEFMYLGMRLTSGVSKERFRTEFAKEMDDVFADAIKKNLELGLMEDSGESYRLTDRGIEISNVVLSDFLLH